MVARADQERNFACAMIALKIIKKRKVVVLCLIVEYLCERNIKYPREDHFSQGSCARESSRTLNLLVMELGTSEFKTNLPSDRFETK